jgi:multiple sugar transport system substrate-binding protein
MEKKPISRRNFLKAAGMLAAGTLSACAAPTTTPVPPTKAPEPTKAAAAPTAVPPTAVPPTAVPTKAPTPAPTKANPISVLVASDKEWVPDQVKKFTAETGIPVNPTIVDWNDLGTKFTVAAASGATTYDVVNVDPSSHGAFMKAGYLEPLDTYLAATKGDLVSPMIFSYNGKIYGMPWFIDALFFFYNTEILSKAGITAPPKTWDELKTQAKTIQQKGLTKYPIAFQWKQIEGNFDVFMTLLFNNGGKLLDETLTKPLFNGPEGVAALQFEADLNLKDKLVDPGSFNMRPLEVMTEMSQERTAFAILWGEVAGSLNDKTKSKVIGKISSSLIPVAKTGNASWTVDGSECIAIPAKSANKDNAWKLISYMTSKTASKEVALNLGALPVWKSLFTDPQVAGNPWNKVFLEQLTNPYSRPGQAWYTEFSTMMQVAIISAFNGSKTAQVALDDAAKKAVDILKKS